jgi:hypothetical protein
MCRVKHHARVWILAAHGFEDQAVALRATLESLLLQVELITLSHASRWEAALAREGRVADAVVLLCHGLDEQDRPEGPRVVDGALSIEVLDDRDPERPEVELLLTPEQIRRDVRWFTPLLVLTGCSAGRSRGFMRAWHDVGVREVIAPDAPVDDTATLVFTIVLFYQLLSGTRDGASAHDIAQATSLAAAVDKGYSEGTTLFRRHSSMQHTTATS